MRFLPHLFENNKAWAEGVRDETERCDRLCELNVIEGVAHVCQTTIVREAWERGQQLSVHGWIYRLQDGLLRDLHVTITGSGSR